MKKVLLASLLAAVVLMFWGFISWTLLSDMLGIIRVVPQEDAVREVLSQNISEPGAYFFPMAGFQGSPEQQESWKAKHTEGPIGFLFFRSQGVAPSGLVMLWGFLHFWTSAVLVSLLLRACPQPGYGRRVLVVALAGLFAAFAIFVSPSIWWYVPWSYTIYALITSVIGWTLAGLVLGKFLAPSS